MNITTQVITHSTIFSTLRFSILLLLIIATLSPSLSIAEEWTYTTRPNDTIWDISKKYLKSVTYWKKLQAHNSVDIAKRLSPGTKLRIPLEWLKIQAAPALVVSVTGKASLHTPGTTTPATLIPKQFVNIGDTVLTGEDGSALIQFADNSSLLIQKSSQVKFNTLSSYGTSGMVDTQLRLQQGRVETTVKPLRGSISRYEITTPAAVAAVRGTAFRVAYQPEQKTMASEVVKGSINVAAEGTKQPIDKGYGSITEKGKPPQPPVKLLEKPNLSNLSETLRHLPYQFKWPSLQDASQYRIQISPSQQADSLSLESSQPTNSYTLTDLSDGNYILRIRGIDNNGLEGFNAEHNFVLSTDFPVVTLINPVNKLETSSEDLIFEWTNEEKASQYRLQISTNVEFSNLVVDETLNSNTYTLKDSLPEKNYFWRISAIDNQGNNGKPSSVESFTVEENPYEVFRILLYLLPALIL